MRRVRFLIRWGLVLACVQTPLVLAVDPLDWFTIVGEGVLDLFLVLPRAAEYGVAGMWLLQSARDAAAAELPAGVLKVPASCFMPYCVCPKCGAEALHWIEITHIDLEDEAALIKLGYNIVSDRRTREIMAGHYRTRPPYLSYEFDYRMRKELQEAKDRRERAEALSLGRQAAVDHNAKHEVTRKCRECGHTWGQKTGTLLEVA